MNNDSRIVQQQIGRELRNDSEVSCRCHLDIPAVIKVPPKLNDGTPFPTTYWLTCPMYNKKIGSLESQGLIKELDKELENNPELKEKWQSRQKSYQTEREKLVKMKMSHSVSPMENPMQIKFARRTIARIMTELSKRNTSKK